MEMGSSDQILQIEPEGEIYKCPTCGYTDGFHISLRMVEAASRAEIYLICPSCHRRFRVGWEIHLK